MYSDGSLFQEFVSHQRLSAPHPPLLHYTYGKCPETARRVVAKGIIAIGQIALGKYVLAQIGWGEHVWDMRGVAPAAQAFFKPLVEWFR